MSIIEQSKDFLSQIGAPARQCNDMCCYVLVALSNMAQKSAWSDAENPWMGPHDIIVYLDTNGIKSYAENSRETIRKNCLRPFRDLAIIEDKSAPQISFTKIAKIKPTMIIVSRTYLGTDDKN